MHTYAHTSLSLYTHVHTCTHLYVILENFALEVIECFVRFLYHGTLDDSPPPELLWELALMGKSYDVPNLQDQCFAWLEYYAFVLSHLQKMVRKVALGGDPEEEHFKTTWSIWRKCCRRSGDNAVVLELAASLVGLFLW